MLHYLDLTPDHKALPDGRVITMNPVKERSVDKCFAQYDLYSTFLGGEVSDEIESMLFGGIDDKGARAVRAFAQNDPAGWHKHFQEFFGYIDAQKARTPKGLSWIRQHYAGLDQNALMQEMQSVRNMHCTIWTEGVREIVSAENSDIKFIVTDHPVTVFNYALDPNSPECSYPNDPDIKLKATQTIFPLDLNHCLILTNTEYARDPENCDPLENRTYAQHHRNSLVRTDQFIVSRKLAPHEVTAINFILKRRARRYLAATEKAWLYPEKETDLNWSECRNILLPPKDELLLLGGEMYVGYEDGHTSYQDEFGRKTPENKHLRKPDIGRNLRPREQCGCGSGKQFQHCCKNLEPHERPTWNVLSIRERNLALCRAIRDITGLDDGKDWNDVRRNFTDEKVKRIYEVYSFLWPSETEFLEMLPKPGKKLKAVYTGIIDPRVISANIVSLTLYFDEIIIQSPFINPNCVKPEFSPIENPAKFKREALKDIFLILQLEPFIDAGFINLIPDICDFDMHLRRQMYDMAEQRSKALPLAEEDVSLMKKLQRADFKRSMYLLPKDVLRRQLKKANTNIDDEDVESAIQYIDQMAENDPLALLGQSDEKENEAGGSHIIMGHLSPNFEISLFLAQVTGAVLLTDNLYRWKEALTALGADVQMKWDQLTLDVNSIQFPLNAHTFRTLDLRIQGKFSRMRMAMNNLLRTIRSAPPEAKKANISKKIMSQLRSAEKLAQSEINAPPVLEDLEDHTERELQGSCSLRIIAPQDGIQHRNTQRMLLSRGGMAHLSDVPVAILIEHNWKYEWL